jgi:hypothetical protein
VKCRITWFPNPLGDGEWSDVMRRQGVTHVCDGPVWSSLQGEASSPSRWQLQGAQPVSSSEDVSKVDYQQQS